MITTPLIIFICHNNATIESTLQKYPSNYICFVGNAEIKEEYRTNTKIIIARDLEYNIENKPKLLTFTAWYAVSRNELFTNYKYICLLEYDVILEENFREKLNEVCETNNPDVVTFIKEFRHFFYDIDERVFQIFLNTKNINYDLNQAWFPTTNHCMRRDLLDHFVEWYFLAAIDIWYLDRRMVSWYHERMYSVYMDVTQKNVYFMHGYLKHIQNGGHSYFNPQNEKKLPKELMELYCKDPFNEETCNKIEEFYI